MASLAIIDYGGANLNSVVFAFERIGIQPVVTCHHETISSASHVVLPGVGAAGAGMARLHDKGLDRLVAELKQPVLGICLGMQLLFDESEEDATRCLGVIPGKVKGLKPMSGITIPHMGWNENQIVGRHELLGGVPTGFYGYFVHGFAAAICDSTLCTSFHGEEFSSVVAHKNFLGIQFHPERSGAAGSLLLKNFLANESVARLSQP